MAKKLKFSSRKNRKNRHVLDVRVLGIRQSVRGLIFAVHCFFFVILKLRIMGLSVLDCRTPYRQLIQCCSNKHIIFLIHEALGNKLSYRYIVTNPSFLNIGRNPSRNSLIAPPSLTTLWSRAPLGRLSSRSAGRVSAISYFALFYYTLSSVQDSFNGCSRR